MKQWGGQSLVAGQSVVLVVDDKAKRASVADEIQAQVQNGKVSVVELGVELRDVTKIDGVIAYGGSHIDNTLQQALAVLNPGGFVVLYVPAAAGVKEDDVQEKLMLSGFVNTKTTKSDEFVEYSSSKPNWEVGASQKLNLKKPASAISSQDAKNIWSSKATADEDLIDEDSLLDESDRNAKPSTKSDDCEIGPGKKACKNCTCGRADGVIEDQPKLTKEMLDNPGVGSSCGSCGLGDAFRCAGCPYRGLPAFKVGEKITIPDNFMDDDI